MATAAWTGLAEIAATPAYSTDLNGSRSLVCAIGCIICFRLGFAALFS